MNNLEIIPLTKEYIDDVVAIDTLSFAVPWSRESFVREVEINNSARYVAAKKDGLIVGYGGVWIIVDEGHITNIATHPEYRGTGIASKIMEALIEICKLEGVLSMTLEVRRSNTPAKNLYAKYGFIEEGVRKNYYSDNKEDAIIMWKRNI